MIEKKIRKELEALTQINFGELTTFDSLHGSEKMDIINCFRSDLIDERENLYDHDRIYQAFQVQKEIKALDEIAQGIDTTNLSHGWDYSQF